MKTFSTLLILLFLTCCSPDVYLPNIIILFDDLGYGDASGVLTPNIDMEFTDAYSAAAAELTLFLLTGRYAFRRNASVLPGDAPLMIPAGSATIASMLKRVGYRTAVVGKWHLGLGDGTGIRISDRGLWMAIMPSCFLQPATVCLRSMWKIIPWSVCPMETIL